MNYVTLKTSCDIITAKSETRHRTEPATLSFFIIKDIFAPKIVLKH